MSQVMEAEICDSCRTTGLFKGIVDGYLADGASPRPHKQKLAVAVLLKPIQRRSRLLIVLKANVTSGKSHGEVTCFSHSLSNPWISSRLRNLVRSLVIANRLTAVAGFALVKSHSTAFLNICLITVNRRFTVARFNVTMARNELPASLCPGRVY